MIIGLMGCQNSTSKTPEEKKVDFSEGALDSIQIEEYKIGDTSFISAIQWIDYLTQIKPLLAKIEEEKVHPSIRKFVLWSDAQSANSPFIRFNALESEKSSPYDSLALHIFYITYPVDSIEYDTPSWILEYKGRSFNTLGEGKILPLIQSIDALHRNSAFSLSAFYSIGSSLIDDICLNNYYWYPKEKCLDELKAIDTYLKENEDSFLSDPCIEVRLKQFNNSDSVNIHWNARAGLG